MPNFCLDLPWFCPPLSNHARTILHSRFLFWVYTLRCLSKPGPSLQANLQRSPLPQATIIAINTMHSLSYSLAWKRTQPPLQDRKATHMTMQAKAFNDQTSNFVLYAKKIMANAVALLIPVQQQYAKALNPLSSPPPSTPQASHTAQRGAQ